MDLIPAPSKDQLVLWLLRLALIGFAASVVSDTVSNSLRVVKTYRQANDTKVSYSKSPLPAPHQASHPVTTTTINIS